MKANKRITVSVISMLLIAGSVLADNNAIKIAPLTDSTIHAIATPSLRVLVEHHINTVKGINNYDWCHTKLSSYSKQDDQRTIDLTERDSPGYHNAVPAS